MTSLSPSIAETRTRKSFLLLVGAVTLTIYLGLSPVYWLPGVSVSVMRVVKLALAASAVLSIYSHGIIKGSLRFPKGILGPVGFFLMVVVAIPGLVQAEFSSAATRLVDFVLSFGFFWCFYNYVREGGNWQVVFKGAALIVAAFATVTLTSAFLGAPNWTAPFGPTRLPLFITGFGAKRTGWSIGIGMFVPIAFLFASRHGSLSRNVRGFIRVALMIVVILGAQIACGGRSGIVASIVVVLVNAWRSPLRWHFVGLMFVALLAALYSADFLTEQLRLDALGTSNVSFRDLDRLSTGRISGYLVALDLIAQRPFVGHGFEQIALDQYGMLYRDVHNLWLQLWVEAGILLPLCFALFALSICVHTFRSGGKRAARRPVSGTKLTLGLIVVGGLVISMFEPRTLIGSFQNTAIWWAAAGVLLAESIMDSRRTAS